MPPIVTKVSSSIVISRWRLSGRRSSYQADVSATQHHRIDHFIALRTDLDEVQIAFLPGTQLVIAVGLTGVGTYRYPGAKVDCPLSAIRMGEDYRRIATPGAGDTEITLAGWPADVPCAR